MPKQVGLIPLQKKVRELERIYSATEKEIAAVLLNVAPATTYSELRAGAAQRAAEALIRQLNRAAVRWSNEAVPMAYEKSHVITKTKLEVLGAEEDVDYNKRQHRYSVEADIEETIDILVASNQSIKNNVGMYLYLVRKAAAGLMQIQQFDPMDEGILGEIITDTIDQGKARGYASKRIHEYLRLKLLDGNFIDKAGRSYRLGPYAKMVARTRLRMAQTSAVKNTCAQHRNDLVQWSRHSDPCPECAEYEGQIYSLSGTHPVYQLLPAEPPLHPNCEHDLSPTSEVAIRFREPYKEAWV